MSACVRACVRINYIHVAAQRNEKKTRAEQYLSAITTLRELLLNVWKGIRDQNVGGTAIEKRQVLRNRIFTCIVSRYAWDDGFADILRSVG
jgi:hypothetical protein